MFELKKKDFSKLNINSYGNMFLIGNGHIGYRGTLDEFGSNEFVGVNLVGIYDQYQDKWRESLNTPNPFFTKVYANGNLQSVLEINPTEHYQKLDIYNGIFSRYTRFEKIIIESTRFVSKVNNDLLITKYKITSLKTQEVVIHSGIDYDIWEINGPHYTSHQINYANEVLSCTSKTNEGKIVTVSTIHDRYDFKELLKENDKAVRTKTKAMEENEVFEFVVYASIIVDDNSLNLSSSKAKDYQKIGYENLFASHQKEMMKRWNLSDVKITGDDEAQFALRYSIYHLLILENDYYVTSIPARGLSGQTYKGAIFWDSEIFMLPFYLLTNPSMAKSLIKYRINTLEGARKKAKQYGYNGAFYAWESQENGQDACSLYNVSDAITNEPIRTYFADKQIHISGDVAYAIKSYVEKTFDYDILLDGGMAVLIECSRFFLSYASYNKKLDRYDINDVIGPDEYHERINNNAFTNYLIYDCVMITIKYLKWLKLNHLDYYFKLLSDLKFDQLAELIEFADKLYLPKPNEDLIIEQFSDYFALEDTTIEEVKSRLKHKNEYWGGKGPASATRIIKQADVVTLLYLYKDLFDDQTKIKNYDYYAKYTEHGSSLSASMYGLLACETLRPNLAYPMFLKSAKIDLGIEQKMYAGSIYIGGTHPASNGGAYMCMIFGFAGLNYGHDGIYFKPSLPDNIHSISFKYYDNNKIKEVSITKDKIDIKEWI